MPRPPIERHPKTGEVILRLRKHPNLILTPPRETDAPKITEYVGDERIWSNLVSPPVPYHIGHAKDWLARLIPERGEVLAEIEKNMDPPLSGCPLQFIRELKDDGSDELIGSIDLTPWPEGRDPPLDALREPGSTEIIWTIGDWLAPSHHGRGIMTDAVQTIILDWGVAQMNISKVIASAFIGNPASVRVFEKCGFKTYSVVEKALEVRGEMKGMHTLLWTRDK